MKKQQKLVTSFEKGGITYEVVEEKYPPAKIGARAVAECCLCHIVRECVYEADPYADDVHNDSTPVWECDPCRRDQVQAI